MGLLRELECLAIRFAVAQRNENVRLRFRESLRNTFAATEDVPVSGIANRDVGDVARFSVDKDVTNLSLWLEITIVRFVTLVITAQLVIARLNLRRELVGRNRHVAHI